MGHRWMLDFSRRTPAQTTYATCAIATAVALAFSMQTQGSVTVEGGLGWDGAQYALLTSQCWKAPLSALEPFVYRIGAPCVAALLPGSPKSTLFAINIASSVLFMFLLTAWLRRLVPDTIVRWLIAGVALHWLMPVRYSWWYPTYVDPPALCAIVGALLLRDRWLPFALVCAAGAFVRETMLVVPAALAAGRCVTLARQRSLARVVVDPAFQRAATGCVAAAAALATAHAVVTPASRYWMADAAFYWAYTKPMPSYVLAWFVTYGPILALPLAHGRSVRKVLSASPEYAILLTAFAALAWVGGTDTERFLLWASPIVLLLIGVAAADVDWRASLGPLALLTTGQVLSGRWFLATPTAPVEGGKRAWPILTALRPNGFEDLLSLTPDRVVSAAALLQYSALTVLLLLWLRRRQA